MTKTKKKLVIKQIRKGKNQQRLVSLNQQAWQRINAIIDNYPGKIARNTFVSDIINDYLDNYAKFEYTEGTEQ